uniref:uncharacterized protein LOC120338398 n=1 Tax=Styela clava TaxID=7725 RepID=UPI0019395EDC|nr:uncharacterized protein LOC120338398 [Styela clava]
MSPDPRDCDVVMCLALILAFMSLMPVILSLGVKEWIVVNGRIKNQTRSNDFEKLEIPDFHPDITDFNGSMTNISKEFYNETNTTAGKFHSSKNHFTGNTTILANFESICLISQTSRHCDSLSTIQNSNYSACLTTGHQHDDEDFIKCNSFLLSRVLSTVPRVFSIVLMMTAVTTMLATIVLDVVMVFDKKDVRVKLLLATLFALSGMIEIASVIFFYTTVFMGHRALEKPRASVGITAYLTFGNGVVSVMIALLIFISLRRRRKKKLPQFIPDSQIDIPRNNEPCVQFEFESSQAVVGDIPFDFRFNSVKKRVNIDVESNPESKKEEARIDDVKYIVRSSPVVLDSADQHESPSLDDKSVDLRSVADEEVSQAITLAKEVFRSFRDKNKEDNIVTDKLKTTARMSQSDYEVDAETSQTMSEKTASLVLSDSHIEFDKESIEVSCFVGEEFKAEQNLFQSQHNIVGVEILESPHGTIATISHHAKEELVQKSFSDIEEIPIEICNA